MEAATIHNLFPDFDGEVTPANLHRLMSRVAELERQLEEQRAELMKARTRRAADDMEDELAGAYQTIKIQNRKIGTLERKVSEEADPLSHPKGKEIVALIERWMKGAGHPKSKIGDDRVKLVKSRLRDGFSIDDLELAIDGICAFPFIVNARRVREGKKSQRHDRMGIALAGSEKVEEFANLGHQARKAGWTVDHGWG